MKKFAYIAEFALLVWLLLPHALNYHGRALVTIPNLSQIKNSIAITPAPTTQVNPDLSVPVVVCGTPQARATGYPFVYKTDDGCGSSTNYKLGLGLDYVIVGIIALIAVKLTSMMVNFVESKLPKKDPYKK